MENGSLSFGVVNLGENVTGGSFRIRPVLDPRLNSEIKITIAQCAISSKSLLQFRTFL